MTYVHWTQKWSILALKRCTINQNKSEMHAASHLPKLAYKLDVVNKREALGFLWFSGKIKAQHLKMKKLSNILQYYSCNVM